MKVRKLSEEELKNLGTRARRDRSGLLSHLLTCYQTLLDNACDPDAETLEFKREILFAIESTKKEGGKHCYWCLTQLANDCLETRNKRLQYWCSLDEIEKHLQVNTDLTDINVFRDGKFIGTLSQLKEEAVLLITRNCSFCDFNGTYDEFPEDSICFGGVMACAECLKKTETEEFRKALKLEIKETVNA